MSTAYTKSQNQHMGKKSMKKKEEKNNNLWATNIPKTNF